MGRTSRTVEETALLLLGYLEKNPIINITKTAAGIEYFFLLRFPLPSKVYRSGNPSNPKKNETEYLYIKSIWIF